MHDFWIAQTVNGLTTVKTHLIKYCEIAYEREGKTSFG